jgi:hypothetical protein
MTAPHSDMRRYIGITCVILLGLGILTGVSRTRSKDPAAV